MIIIMCFGGVYVFLVMDYEGYDMVLWFNLLGIIYVVLKYWMFNGYCEVFLLDVE